MWLSVKAQRGFIETGLFGNQTYNLDVVPTGSWAVVLDHPTKEWFGHQVLVDVV